MQNKKNALALQDIEFPQENGVHIAGVTCSSHVSPTIPFQSLSQGSQSKDTESLGSDVPDRFWKWVDVGVPGECWPWKGSRDRYGYGRSTLNGKYVAASRAAYVYATGQDVDGLLVCHHCDNPACCNPSHLYAGTAGDNERDKFKRGHKTHRGMKNPARKLTSEQVENVRQLFRQGMTNVAIGKMLGVHHSTISKIRTGNSWESPQERADA